MGRHENAVTDRTIADRLDPRSQSNPGAMVATSGAAILLACAPLLAATPPDMRASSPPASAIAQPDARSAIEMLLSDGDTLEAIERLQDLAGSGWTDSLLDVLVLPDELPRPHPRAAARRWHPALRIDAGRIPSSTIDAGFWSTSVQASAGRGFAFGGIDQWIALGLRSHGLQADDQTYAGLEPRIGWSSNGRRIETTADAWALAGPDLDADAGFGSDLRFLATRELWLGAGFDLSLESTQEAAIGAGFDRHRGSWTWSGSLNLGWIRMIAPANFSPQAMEIDSIVVNRRFDDGSLGVIGGWNGADLLSQTELPESLALSRYALESFDRDRSRLRARIALIRTMGRFRLGPATELDLRTSTRSERWMPNARETWSETTSFLRLRGRTDAYAIAGSGDLLTARDAGEIIEAWYACARVSPALRGDWSTPDHLWQLEFLAAWNLVATTDRGHPLEDDQEGLSARASMQRRW